MSPSAVGSSTGLVMDWVVGSEASGSRPAIRRISLLVSPVHQLRKPSMPRMSSSPFTCSSMALSWGERRRRSCIARRMSVMLIEEVSWMGEAWGERRRWCRRVCWERRRR